ncbi:carboxylesterase family protein [Podospora didyma]|uniref:Carboxylesterase family protein n=1 Tax=Podospora didyma TaxID=330526 RepID=A0AAE0NYQ8_9PEZI|nr:carboxylesterase family protein [Podospora didyma]
MHFPILEVSLMALAVYAQASTPPSIALDWGIWQSQVDSLDSKIYVWNNVRFADEPPRFGKPSFPKGKNTSSTIDSCYQASPRSERFPAIQLPRDTVPQGEDCLGLDIYAPVDNFDDNGGVGEPLPVIVWIYGGGYTAGTKRPDPDMLYTGQSILRATGYKAIFVAGNYRLGAFGWLAGNYMETLTSQGEAQTNAGLYDQALMLQFVSQFISKVGGDPGKISVWGESAGASSIMHHLVREGGTVDPGFRSFFVQSPAFQWSWDNSPGGTMDKTFQSFSGKAKCGTVFNITCLKGRDVSDLVQANQDIVDDAWGNHMFPVGPSIDNGWIQNLPALTFSTAGSYWPTINSALISHTGNEAFLFTPITSIVTKQTIIDFLSKFFPGETLQSVRDQILGNYTKPCDSTYPGWKTCLNHIIRDSSFTCNTRWLHDAYPKANRWMMAYNFPNPVEAVHAFDLVPLYMNTFQDAFNLIRRNAPKLIPDSTVSSIASGVSNVVMQTYQAYAGSFGVSGDPNPVKLPAAAAWPTAQAGTAYGNVMGVSNANGWALGPDTKNTEGICQFWNGIATQVMAARGKQEEVKDDL